MGKPGKLLTRAELAKALDVNAQTITKWVGAGMPVERKGRRAGQNHQYREADVRAWLEEREAANHGEAIDLTQARTRKELAMAILNELKAAEMKRDLLPREDVEMQSAAEKAAVKAKLLAWSTTLADALHRAAARHGVAGIERLLNHEVREVLSELADPERPIECPCCGVDLAVAGELAADGRCRAWTATGDRCKNAAGDDGYCHIKSHRPAA